MRILGAATRGARHLTGAIAEGALILAVVGALAFATAVVGRGEPAGAWAVDAAQKVKATMTASPTTVAAGSSVHVAGSALDPSRATWLRVTTPSAMTWYSLGVASDGTFGIDVRLDTPGTTNLSVLQVVNNRTVLASTQSVLVQ